MRIALRFAVSAALLASAVAYAGPKDELKAAMAKFIAAKSYHVEMTHDGAKGMTTSADFEAPDRMRLQTPAGTQYLIGDTMHMTIDGRTMAVPLQKGMLTQWRDPANLAKHEKTMTVEALGNDSVGGKPAKKYRTRNTQPQPSTSTMWVGADGYPLQIQATSSAQGKTATTTIRYSRFNDPSIRIAPPK